MLHRLAASDAERVVAFVELAAGELAESGGGLVACAPGAAAQALEKRAFIPISLEC